MYRGKVLLERTKNRPTVFEKTFSRQVFFFGKRQPPTIFEIYRRGVFDKNLRPQSIFEETYSSQVF
jgi:hypothetical protein